MLCRSVKQSRQYTAEKYHTILARWYSTVSFYGQTTSSANKKIRYIIYVTSFLIGLECAQPQTKKQTQPGYSVTAVSSRVTKMRISPRICRQYKKSKRNVQINILVRDSGVLQRSNHNLAPSHRNKALFEIAPRLLSLQSTEAVQRRGAAGHKRHECVVCWCTSWMQWRADFKIWGAIYGVQENTTKASECHGQVSDGIIKPKTYLRCISNEERSTSLLHWAIETMWVFSFVIGCHYAPSLPKLGDRKVRVWGNLPIA